MDVRAGGTVPSCTKNLVMRLLGWFEVLQCAQDLLSTCLSAPTDKRGLAAPHARSVPASATIYSECFTAAALASRASDVLSLQVGVKFERKRSVYRVVGS